MQCWTWGYFNKICTAEAHLSQEHDSNAVYFMHMGWIFLGIPVMGKVQQGLTWIKSTVTKPRDVITGKISDNGSKDQKRGLTVWIHGKWRVFCGKYKIDTFFKICNIFWYFTRPCHIFRDPIKLTHAAPPTHLWEYPAVPVTAAALTPKQLFEKNLVGNMEATHHVHICSHETQLVWLKYESRISGALSIFQRLPCMWLKTCWVSKLHIFSYSTRVTRHHSLKKTTSLELSWTVWE